MKDSRSGNAIDFLLLRRVMRFSLPYKKILVLSVLLSILLSFLGPLRPYLIKIIIDEYILIPDLTQLRNMCLILITLLFLESIVQFFYIYLATWLGQHVIQDLRSKVYSHILGFRMKYFDNTPIGTLVTRTISDIETIADIFSQGLFTIIGELLKLLVVVGFMFFVDWRLAAISLITIPLLVVATSWFKRNIKIAFQQVRTQVANINTFVQEHIVGMNIVQIFNRERAEYNKFKGINKDHLSANLSSIFYYSIFFPIVEILSALSIGLVVCWGGIWIVDGNNLELGDITSFILYIYMMFRPIRQLADRFNILQMGIVGSERVFKVLDTKENIKDNGNVIRKDIRGFIEYHNVKFAYNPPDWVLKGISFNIEPGKKLALVGTTGSGKTSIINVLNRSYDIQEGSIKIDDSEIRDFRLRNLRKHISIVQQEVHLFSDTIMNNITLYDEISQEDVLKASKEIGIHDFIMSLPNGYDYVVGERGVTLSTGQRQLIAFLRVYLRDPKILILDEATSSIDSSTEDMIQMALNKLSKNRTTIIIAHRLSTIIHADKILFLSEGSVIEEGTHQYLISLKGKYKTMYDAQMNQ